MNFTHLREELSISKLSHLATITVFFFIFLAIPVTVFVITNSEQDSKSAQALTNFELNDCATNRDPAGNSQCGHTPGNPDDYYFCDRWTGGFCNDYRYIQLNNATGEREFGTDPRDSVSVDCLSSTNAGQTSWLPYYVPTNMTAWDASDVPGKQDIPFPCAFSKYEHFMTRMEDGQFGMVIMRQKRPFDFAGRTGHIHVDLDMKTLERRYGRITLSPSLTKMGVDDRNMYPQPEPSFEIWFRNGTFQGKLAKGGQVIDLFPPCNGCGPRYYGTDNVRDSIDVYISRTHVKINVNNKTQVDQDIQDIGFDRGYLYLQHVNYNSCKAYAIEGYATLAECQIAGNTFHWDNVAFDGPTLPENSLTPAGSEDVVFNAWAQASCTVKGVAAKGSGRDFVWQTWVARLPVNTAVAASDVKCSLGGNQSQWYRGVPMGLEVVQQGSSGGGTPGDTTKPTVSLTAPSNGATNLSGKVNLTANASDNVAVSQVQFFVDNNNVGTSGTSPYTFSWDSTKVANGSHTIFARAFDTSGNQADSSIITVSISNTAPPPPQVVEIYDPAPGSTISGTVSVYSRNTSGSTSGNVTYILDIASTNSVIGTDNTSPYWIDWDTTKVKNGSHTVTVRRTDIAAADATVTYNVQNGTGTPVDITPPTINITAPNAGATVSGAVTVSAEASDNVAVKQVEFRVDGVSQKTLTSAPYSFTWNAPSINGSYTISAIATDTSDNKSSDSISVTVKNADVDPPTDPTNLKAVANSPTSVALTWSPSTDNSGGQITYWVARSAPIQTLGSSKVASYTDNTASPSTKYSYIVIAQDPSGNFSKSVSVDITTPALADTEAPTAPTNLRGVAVSPNQINLSWSPATDNVGVTYYKIFRNNSQVGMVPASSTSFGDTGLIAATDYNYFVAAVDAALNSTKSSVILVTTLTPPSSKGAITGTIKGSDTNSGIRGSKAIIWIGGSRVIQYADSSGKYFFGNLESSTYSLKYNARGYRAQTASVSVPAGQTVTKDITLQKQ